jgi:hypothetical protein
MGRPTAITVIGAIGIVLAVLGLCGNLCGAMAGPFMGTIGEMASQAQDPQTQMQAQLFKDPTYQRLIVLSALVGLILAFMLLVSAILLLRMSPLGYNLMLVYSGVSILWTIVSLVLSVAVVMPIQRRILGESAGADFMLAVGGIMGVIQTLLALIYPVAVLIVLTRPAIKERFSG